MPVVKVFVRVLSHDMSVFHDTMPPVVGSGKLSGAICAMSDVWRTSGLTAWRFEVVELMRDADAV